MSSSYSEDLYVYMCENMNFSVPVSSRLNVSPGCRLNRLEPAPRGSGYFKELDNLSNSAKNLNGFIQCATQHCGIYRRML